MNQIINVASYIMGRIDGLNDRDLQRLCFYSQAAFLVQTGKPLFEEDFLAWKTGPVCLELKSFLSSKKKPSDKTLFSPEEQSCMEDVIARYGKLSSFSLDQRCLSDMLDILVQSFFLWDERCVTGQWRLMSMSFKKKYSSSG